MLASESTISSHRSNDASGIIRSSFLSHLERFFLSSPVQYNLIAECSWDRVTSLMLCMPNAQRMTAVALSLLKSIWKKNGQINLFWYQNSASVVITRIYLCMAVIIVRSTYQMTMSWEY